MSNTWWGAACNMKPRVHSWLDPKVTSSEQFEELAALREGEQPDCYDSEESFMLLLFMSEAFDARTETEVQTDWQVAGWQQRYIDPIEGPQPWQPCTDKAIIAGRKDYEVRTVYVSPSDFGESRRQIRFVQGCCDA